MIGFLLLLRVHIITSPRALKGLRGRGFFFLLFLLSHNILKKLRHHREKELKCFSRYQQVLHQKG